jgi:hypothetical protein
MYKIALVLCIILIALPFSHVLAGPGFGSGIQDIPAGGGSAPLDGGLSLLVAAGIGYGAKKFRGKKKHSAADIKAIEKYIHK